MLQATPAGIKNQDPVPLQSDSDAMDPVTSRPVSMIILELVLGLE